MGVSGGSPVTISLSFLFHFYRSLPLLIFLTLGVPYPNNHFVIKTYRIDLLPLPPSAAVGSTTVHWRSTRSQMLLAGLRYCPYPSYTLLAVRRTSTARPRGPFPPTPACPPHHGSSFGYPRSMILPEAPAAFVAATQSRCGN